jgi:hypothetical protein
MSIQVYLAKEDNVIYYCNDTGYILRIQNSQEPAVMPARGLIERSKIFGIKTDSAEPSAEILLQSDSWPELACICQDLDTPNENEIEYYLICNEDEELVATLDTINMDSFHCIGSYQYQTEFQKIFYKNS